MTYNYLFEKYKNLNSEEDFVNDYSYQNPLKLKFDDSSKFKRPKLFHINKNIENFESFKSGSEKTLQEFQHLFIQKFFISSKKKTKIIKKSPILLGIKEKIRKNCKIINNKIKNKDKIDKYNSLMKIIKENNINENIPKRKLSRSIGQFLKANPQSSSKSMRKSSFNITERNKYLTYQYLKHGEKFLTKSEQIPKGQSIHLFQEKSHFSLLKQISEKIIHNSRNNIIILTNKINTRSNSSYINNRYENMKSNFDLKENKAFINNNKSNFVKNNNVKYYEVSKNNCNLSEALIVEKKEYPNTIKKKKKKERIKPAKYIAYLKRPLSSLERYYIKYGAIP